MRKWVIGVLAWAVVTVLLRAPVELAIDNLISSVNAELAGRWALAVQWISWPIALGLVGACIWAVYLVGKREGSASVLGREVGIDRVSGRSVTLPKGEINRWRRILAKQEQQKRNKRYALEGVVVTEPMDFEGINERAVRQVRIEMGLDAPPDLAVAAPSPQISISSTGAKHIKDLVSQGERIQGFIIPNTAWTYQRIVDESDRWVRDVNQAAYKYFPHDKAVWVTSTTGLDYETEAMKYPRWHVDLAYKRIHIDHLLGRLMQAASVLSVTRNERR